MAAPAAQHDGVHIRKGALADVELVASFNQAMAKETEDLAIPHDVVTRGAKAVLEGKAAAAYYLLEVDGENGGDAADDGHKVVAQLMITFEWSDWRAADVWWVQSVYVRPEYRRRGYFRALYAHVRAEAQAAGAAGLRLYADVGNERAHRAYEGLGMRSHYKVFEDMFTSY
ncbi:hypothetical protein HYH03_015823 [Edaphochlamys debaryana]|uniref:N-acetyltransferase domain-containing protein n=1 Tax=Edaphochlamys debaryana TaxID=47281 RepID=A0A835XL23_9CHLO|nr:hypothetical protein HYH03_015823 [Edaphochlamys debaryana]|eukprot:KAG2485444.1 hypothetical protein HYH03_015823 [Edaphochlamys debaryana]